MKKTLFYLLLIFSIILFFGCADSSDEATETDNKTTITDTDGETGDDQVGEDGELTGEGTDDDPIGISSKKVLIGNASNLLVQPQTPLGSMFSISGDAESGLQTLTTDGLVNIEIQGLPGKTPVRGYTISGSNLIKAALTLRDSSGDISTCLIDQSDNCLEIDLDPQKTSKFGNSDYFIEQENSIYYLTADKRLVKANLSSVSGKLMSISGDSTTDIAEGVEQFEIDPSGAIMYESFGNVDLMLSDGSIVPMDGGGWDGRNPLSLDAVSRKFFIGRKDQGFTFYTQWGYFGNLYYDLNGDPETSHAQPVAWDAYINQGLNGVYFAVNTNQSPSNCNKYTVRGKDLVICGNEVFELGTELIDLKKIDFVWVGIDGDYNVEKIIANSQYLFFYMSSESVGNRLTIVDPENFECSHLFSSDDSNMFSAELNGFVVCQSLSDILYSIDQQSVTQNNTINFCGSRDGTNYIVQITNADTTPQFTETPGTCESIVSIQ